MTSFQKKAILLSLVIAFGVTLWKKNQHEYIKSNTEQAWFHYHKDDSGKLIQKSVSESVIDKLTRTSGSQIDRSPANTPPAPSKNKKAENKIVFINPHNPNKKPELNELKFVNSYNPKWKELLANELMLYQKENVEVFFKPQKSVVKILDKNRAMFLEEVIVTYKTNRGPYSFKALVDSENGKIKETWGKTQHEFYSPRLPASSRGLSPSGTL